MDTPRLHPLELADGRDDLPDDRPRTDAIALGHPAGALPPQLRRGLRRPGLGLGPAGRQVAVVLRAAAGPDPRRWLRPRHLDSTSPTNLLRRGRRLSRRPGPAAAAGA